MFFLFQKVSSGQVFIFTFLQFFLLIEKKESALLLGGTAAAGTLGLTRLEAVLEAAGDVLEVTRAAGANSLSALGLVRPVV